MDLVEILKMYNDEGLSLLQISKKIGKSKSTIYRMFSSAGYFLNRKTGKYEINVSHETINNNNNESNVSHETINNDETINNNNNSETNVSRETIEAMVARTYNISSSMDKAIRIKSAIEGTKPVDVVRAALKAYVEPKYLDM